MGYKFPLSCGLLEFLLGGGYITQYSYSAPLVCSVLEGQNPSVLHFFHNLSSGIYQIAREWKERAVLFCCLHLSNNF